MNPKAIRILAFVASGPAEGIYGLQAREALKMSPSVYPMLRTLERDGYLTSYETGPKPRAGRLARKMYQITDAGRAAVARATEVSVAPGVCRNCHGSREYIDVITDELAICPCKPEWRQPPAPAPDRVFESGLFEDEGDE